MADWLERSPSDGLETPPPELSFTEPNLAFRTGGVADGEVTIHVDLDYEFTPPWDRHTYAGDPFTVSVRTRAVELRRAADEWDSDAAPYPDGLALGAT